MPNTEKAHIAPMILRIMDTSSANWIIDWDRLFFKKVKIDAYQDYSTSLYPVNNFLDTVFAN